MGYNRWAMVTLVSFSRKFSFRANAQFGPSFKEPYISQSAPRIFLETCNKMEHKQAKEALANFPKNTFSEEMENLGQI